MTTHRSLRATAVAAGATGRAEAASNGAKAEAVAAPCERPNRRYDGARVSGVRRSAFPFFFLAGPRASSPAGHAHEPVMQYILISTLYSHTAP